MLAILEQASKSIRVVVDGKALFIYGPGVTRTNAEGFLKREGYVFAPGSVWKGDVYYNGHVRPVVKT